MVTYELHHVPVHAVTVMTTTRERSGTLVSLWPGRVTVLGGRALGSGPGMTALSGKVFQGEEQRALSLGFR